MKKDDFMKIVRSKAKEPLDEQAENMFGSIGEAIESALSAESVERNKQLKTITDKLGTTPEGKDFATIIRNLGVTVDSLEAKTKRNLTSDDRFKLKQKLEDKKDEIMRAKGSNTPWAIEFSAKRAASAMMTTSTILTGASAINTFGVVDDLEVLVIQYPKNFIIDAIGGRQIAKVPPVLRWKEQNTESTDAVGFTSEGAVKQLTDKSFVWKTAERKKYAGRIEFTEELAMDFDQLLLQIIDMFEQQVIRSWNTAVQASLVAYCSAYTTSELDATFINPGTSQVIQALNRTKAELKPRQY